MRLWTYQAERHPAESQKQCSEEEEEKLEDRNAPFVESAAHSNSTVSMTINDDGKSSITSEGTLLEQTAVSTDDDDDVWGDIPDIIVTTPSGVQLSGRDIWQWQPMRYHNSYRRMVKRWRQQDLLSPLSCRR